MGDSVKDIDIEMLCLIRSINNEILINAKRQIHSVLKKKVIWLMSADPNMHILKHILMTYFMKIKQLSSKI